MRVAFLTEYASTDIRHWSGTPFFMARALEGTFDEVVRIEVPHFSSLAGSIEHRLRTIGELASWRVRESRIDAVVCQGNSAVPFLDVRVPVTFWHDSTWASLALGHHGSVRPFDVFCREEPELKQWDERALEGATFVAFAADWLVENTNANYSTPLDKLVVLPYGASLSELPDAIQARDFIGQRSRDRCHLTFLGKDWRRKGLPLAAMVVDRLNQLGLRASLTVVGCDEDEDEAPGSPHVRYRGFIDKATPDGEGQLRDILRDTHFLLHPATFECFGIALVEANAFGVPVVGTPVQGLRTIVRPGENGWLFPRDDYVESACSAILKEFAHYDDAYVPHALSAFDAYQTRLRWSVGTSKLRRLLETFVYASSCRTGQATPSGTDGRRLQDLQPG